jgi:hypothetical protein
MAFELAEFPHGSTKWAIAVCRCAILETNTTILAWIWRAWITSVDYANTHFIIGIRRPYF